MHIESLAWDDDFTKIECIEILNAAGVILFKFKCPICDNIELAGRSKSLTCSSCKTGFDKYYLDIRNSNKRVITGAANRRHRNPRISKKIVQKKYHSQNGICAYCDEDLNYDFHVEHINPWTYSRSNEEVNIVLSCKRCNHLASSFVFNSFEDKREYILAKRRKEIKK